MGSARPFRTGTVAAVIAWKLTVLALLPAALCCRAAMAADGGAVLACCEGGEHGAMCPLKRGHADETDPPPDQPRMAGCGNLDDALIGLLGLTGFTPDSFELTADPAAAGRVADRGQAADSFVGLLGPPPPRA